MIFSITKKLLNMLVTIQILIFFNFNKVTDNIIYIARINFQNLVKLLRLISTGLKNVIYKIHNKWPYIQLYISKVNK